MEISRSVALVGRPNVGKSRLFNRLAGKRISIVHDQPGVTRDLVTVQVPADRGGYLLMDTGGIGLAAGAAPAAIIRATEEQVDFALQAAALVLFVVDAREGLTMADEHIVERLRTSRKKVLLVANKADNPRLESGAAAEFSKLGLGAAVPVSAEHGPGIENLQMRIAQIFGPLPEVEEGGEPPKESAARVKFALIGRPNVGKSSLGNALLKSGRLIVSDVPGTTRDAVAIDFDYDAPGGEKWPFTILDTAGLRHGSKVKTSVEYFSQNRTREAIESCDVVFLVLDALEGVTKQDKLLAGDALRTGAGLVVVVNKWDIAEKRFERQPLQGYKNLNEFRKSFVRAVERELFFLPQSPLIFTSAKEGTAVEDILKEARAVYDTMRRELPTGPLNRQIKDFLDASPPKFVGAARFKCYYALQVGRQPFVIRMYCNREERLDENYARHLAAGLQTAFKLHGCPIRFALVGKPPREQAGKRLNQPPRNWRGKQPKFSAKSSLPPMGE